MEETTAVRTSAALLLRKLAEGCSSDAQNASAVAQAGAEGSADELSASDVADLLTSRGGLRACWEKICIDLLGSADFVQLDQDGESPEDVGAASTAASNVPASSTDAELEKAEIGVTQVPSCGGRRHACWSTSPQGQGGNAVGRRLARDASLEACSFASFHDLARELAEHNAPNHLIEAIERAMKDEMVHALMMSKLAERWGGQPEAVSLEKPAPRTLLQIALENAKEGCAEEAFTALIRAVQARRASDSRIRKALQTVSADELSHAQLAWDLHEWFLSELSPEEGAQVERHLKESLELLCHSPQCERLAEGQRRVLGLPTEEEARFLASQMMAGFCPETKIRSA